MTYHLTPSGHVEFIAQWGHGKGTAPNPRRPATLITDDGDGHFEQWKYTGKLHDALVTLARLEKWVRSGGHVAVVEGAGYRVKMTPEDFWIEILEGDFVPNLAKYPDVIAY